MTQRSPAPGTLGLQSGQPPEPDPDQAWKALGLMNDWIRHAETKTGATLAAAGVGGGVLYNLVKDQQHPSSWLTVAALLCGLATLTSAACALIGLVPRLDLRHWTERLHLRKPRPCPAPTLDSEEDRPPEDPTSVLFYHDIARIYGSDEAPTYADVLATLTSDRTQLTRQIGLQVHANAHVARRKYRWSTWAIRALGFDLAFLAWTAVVVAHH